MKSQQSYIVVSTDTQKIKGLADSRWAADLCASMGQEPRQVHPADKSLADAVMKRGAVRWTLKDGIATLA